MYPTICNRWQRFLRCILACVTGGLGFGKVSYHVLHVSMVLAVYPSMCNMCIWLLECIRVCVKGVLGFDN